MLHFATGIHTVCIIYKHALCFILQQEYKRSVLFTNMHCALFCTRNTNGLYYLQTCIVLYFATGIHTVCIIYKYALYFILQQEYTRSVLFTNMHCALFCNRNTHGLYYLQTCIVLYFATGIHTVCIIYKHALYFILQQEYTRSVLFTNMHCALFCNRNTHGLYYLQTCIVLYFATGIHTVCIIYKHALCFILQQEYTRSVLFTNMHGALF